MTYIDIKNCTKIFKNGMEKIYANNNINFVINRGELVIILGSSGAGKSTLLNILGGMENCSSGDIIIDGKNISHYSHKKLTQYRRYDVGFVFQFYNLIPNLTAKENVELAAELVANAMPADKALKLVGLENRMNNFPSQLSGGEQQRVAIARAIAKNPKLLLCDEPTGALDYKTGKKILNLLQTMCHNSGVTTIIVTHNSAIAPIADKIIHIQDGQVKKMDINSDPTSIDDIEW
ncbi:ABC transporter ATP-binding protein [Lactobacillus iners]|jgi:ABC transporter, ATP-binding protein|uniref:ABC transporter ATP-binding protein n=1 Tax=Lactobacillus iners TaxID=147802 RepID=UPI0001E5E3BE|nr:ABC transporter, ATP-binding protein [Lactobacillus iners SPIN 2503V10-D]